MLPAASNIHVHNPSTSKTLTPSFSSSPAKDCLLPSKTMKYTLGSRAQSALSSSLGKLNHTFKSSLSSFSAGSFSGVIQNHSSWTAAEARVWLLVLVVGVVLLYGNQVALALKLGDVGETEGWSISIKTAVLASFYCGRSLTPLLSHHVSERHGGETVQWACAIVWSVCLALTAPLLSRSKMILVPLQFFRGMAQGFHIPALFCIVSVRCDEGHRVFLLSLLLSLAALGPCFLSLTVSLATINTDHAPTDQPIAARHWTSSMAWFIFLAVPLMGVVWAGLVRYLLARSSVLHKTHYNLSEMKTPAEGGHLVALRGSGSPLTNPGTSGRGFGGRERVKMASHSPSNGKTGFLWKRTLKNPSIIVLLVGHFSLNLFFQFTMTWLPMHWSSAHPDHMVQWSVLPWVAMVVGALGATGVGYLTGGNKKGLPSTRHVLVLTSLGGLFMSLVTMATSDHTHPSLQLWATASACVFYGASVPLSVSALRITPPQFTGTLFATLEMVQSISGIVSMFITGVSIATRDSPRLALGMMALMVSLAFLLYLACGTGRKHHTTGS